MLLFLEGESVGKNLGKVGGRGGDGGKKEVDAGSVGGDVRLYGNGLQMNEEISVRSRNNGILVLEFRK